MMQRTLSLLAAVALCCLVTYGSGQYHPEEHGFSYVGCYGDTSRRDLRTRIAYSRMSVEYCYRECDRLRYQYFGLQSGNHCYCGNTYGLYGQKSERECNRRCTGNRDEFCGGAWRNCIYRIHRDDCDKRHPSK